MAGATAEARALDAYYVAAKDAKELVEKNLLDEGMEKWERALNDVAPHISSERLNTLRLESSNLFPLRDEKPLDDDIDLDYSDELDDIDDSDAEGVNDSPDVDDSAIYRDEYMKLMKRHTLPNRSSTISILKRRETGQIPRSSFRFNDDRSDRPREDAGSTARSSEQTTSGKPTTSSISMIVSEPTLNLALSRSNIGGSSRGDDLVTVSSAWQHTSTAPRGLMGRTENDDWFNNLTSIVHNFVYGKKKEFWPTTQPVKVAILDSGFVLTGKVRKAMQRYFSDRIKDQMTFTHEFPNPKTPTENPRALDDPVGHGTTVAYQLIKTCPSAEVYIAKVTIAESDHEKAVPV